MRFDVIDRCPVPRQIAEPVRMIKRRVKAKTGREPVLNSAFRGDPAESLLRRLGKSTQRMLYRGWVRRLPGFAPANPPGFSTHECFSDGVAYRGPKGRPIRPWGCGLDWGPPDLLDDVDRAARELGFALFRPYRDGREAHHRNFARRPKLKKPAKRRARDNTRAKATPKRVSRACVDLVASFEGYRRDVYLDAVGVPTIGYGETNPAIISRYRAAGIDERTARALLVVRLNEFGAGVRSLVRVQLTQLQFDALVAFAYNVGLGALRTSTLLRELNARRPRRAANQLLRWDKAGGRVLLGLSRRRRAERRLFLRGTPARKAGK